MRQSTREAFAGYTYLIPNFCGFLLFTSLPVLFSLMLSFCRWNLLTWPPKFVGFGNFAHLIGFSRLDGAARGAGTFWMALFVLLLMGAVLCVLTLMRSLGMPESRKRSGLRWAAIVGGVLVAIAIRHTARVAFGAYWRPNDSQFWQYFGNTVYLMMGIPLGMFISLMLALVMNQKLKGIVVFRTIFFLPNFTAGVAICLLWKWLYNADYGLINNLIHGVTSFLNDIFQFLFGWMTSASIVWSGPDWLGDPAWSKPAFILMGLWSGAGGMNMILYLAALQNINPELYEAAEIDGAGKLSKFRNITWPLISPTTFFITIMSVIGGFQGGFQAAFIMTQGGPAGSTTTMSYYIYNNAFEFYRMGYAAAIAWVLFLCVFSVTLVNWRYGGKLVSYD